MTPSSRRGGWKRVSGNACRNHRRCPVPGAADRSTGAMGTRPLALFSSLLGCDPAARVFRRPQGTVPSSSGRAAVSPVENRAPGEELWAVPPSPQSLGRSEGCQAHPGGDKEGETPREQSRLCALVSHGLEPKQVTAQASSASGQPWAAPKLSASLQPYSLQDPRPLLPEPRTQESSIPDSLFLNSGV